MSTKDVQIETYQESSYSTVHFINVTEENPCDPLSKVFKKYTHTIQYSPSGLYVPSEYSINVFEKFKL